METQTMLKSQQIESKAANEWIDRYVNEVGRRLPSNQRTDVEREIRSLIEDEVAGRLEAQDAAEGSRPDHEAVVLAVLQTFGAPEEMAARYYMPRTLIGPAMMPIYRIVLGIALAITLVVSILDLILDGGATMAEPLVDILLSLLGNAVQAFGSVTLIFIILERFGLGGEGNAPVWNPTSLPPVKDPNRISIAETVTEIAFTAVAIVLANAYLNPETGALYLNGERQPFPLFSPEVVQYVPWLTVVWGADILVNIVLLVRGRWEPATRVAAMIAAAASGFVFFRMAVGGPLSALSPLDPIFKVSAAVVVVFCLWEIGKHGWYLVRDRSAVEDTMRSPRLA